MGDVPAEPRDLADDRGRNERVLLRRGQEQRFDVRMQVAVHPRHLEFVFEVGNRAQTTQDDPRPLLADKVHQQRGKADDLDVGKRGQRLPRHRHPLGPREHRPFGFAVGHPHDDMVEHARRAPHEVLVAARERVERAGVDDFDHGGKVVAGPSARLNR